MKDIFANLYNKVMSFFHQAEAETAENAKSVACNRLKLVLMQDRTNLSPAIMDRMRRELVDLLSKYLELDRELLDLSFEQEDSQMALMLSIPVVRAKTEEEIREILEQEDASKEDDDTEETDAEEDEESEDTADETEAESESESEEVDSEDDSEEKTDEEDVEVDSEEEMTEEVEEDNTDETSDKSEKKAKATKSK